MRKHVLAALLSGVISGVWAQETVETIALPETAAPEMKADETAAEPARLDDIVVTATKRAAPVRDIPATINVLSGEDLERQGVQDLDGIVAQVPGVNLAPAGDGSPARVTIRGVSADINANFTAGTVFGDIPFTDPFVPKVQLDPNPFDMATVEVLKGPQGTLFGGTGLNGLIRYVPEPANPDGFQLKYYTQLTSYPGNGGSGWNYGAAINAPMADHTAALRVMAFHRDAPGYIDNVRARQPDNNTATQYGARAMFAWIPAQDWKLSLMGATQTYRMDDSSTTDNHEGELTRGNTPRASPGQYRYTLANLGIERAFEWGDLVSQTSYTTKDFELFLDGSRLVPGGALPVLGLSDANHSESVSQELRLVSATGDSPWKWLAGAFYFQTQLYDCAEAGVLTGLPVLPIPIPGPLEGVSANYCPGNAANLAGSLNIGQLLADVEVEETALFGELTRELGEQWEVTAGARVYRTQSGGTVSTKGALYSAQNLLLPSVRENVLQERGISPKASLVFHPSRDLRAYFTASRGFRFGGPQIGASTPTTKVPEVYKSDSLWNYELGLRTDWLDQSLRIDGSVYRIVWTNPQVRQLSRDGLVQFQDNVGGVKGLGSEVALRYLPPLLPGLSLSTTVAWNRTQTSTPFDSVSGDTVAAGSPWPLAPTWQTSTTVAYVLPVGEWQAGASLRHAYTSQACNDIDCNALVFGYRTLDFNVYANGPEGSWWPQLSLGLDNLTDERGIANVQSNPTLGDSVNYIAPRTLVLRLSGNF